MAAKKKTTKSGPTPKRTTKTSSPKPSTSKTPKAKASPKVKPAKGSTKAKPAKTKPAKGATKPAKAKPAKTKPAKAKPAANSAQAWTNAEAFLSSAWPALVATRSPREEPIAAPIEAQFGAFDLDVPPAVRDYLAPLATHEAPPLLDLVPGSYAPVFEPNVGNRAEAVLVGAQEYRPLWAQIFAGTFEIGSTGVGDIWMLAKDPFGKGKEPIYLFDHDSEVLDGPVADSLATFVFAQAAAAAVRDEAIDEDTFDRASRAVNGKIVPASFGERFDVDAYEPEDSTTTYLQFRADWLVTLLAEKDPSDLEVRRQFDLKANAPINAALLTKRAAMFDPFPPTAFYTCLALYFAGDEALARKAADLAADAKNRLVRDLGTLLREVLDGTRRALGIVEDLPALRARVQAMKLYEAPAKRATTAADGPIDALFRANGYRDEAAITSCIAKGDRSLVPRLVERAQDPAEKRGTYIEILAAWRIAEAIEPLAPIAREVDRFHIVRRAFVELVHAAGGPAHAALLVGILKQFGSKAGTRDSYLDAVVARTIVAAADLNAEAALPLVTPHVASKATDTTTGTPISVRDAALFAAGELGAKDLVAAVRSRLDGEEVWQGTGLRWAAGRLGLLADDATRAAISARLDAARLQNRTVTGIDGVDRQWQREELFDGSTGNMGSTIAAEIALEHSRVLLGADPEPLAYLVREAITKSEEEEAHLWALYALRSRPELGVAQAAPLLEGGNELVRMLARKLLAR